MHFVFKSPAPHRPSLETPSQRVENAWAAACGADLVLAVVDAPRQLSQPDPRVARLLSELPARLGLASSAAAFCDSPAAGQHAAGGGRRGPAALLLLNKVDAVAEPYRRLLPGLERRLLALAPGCFEATLRMSALQRVGTRELLAHLLARALPDRPWPLPAAELTDRPAAALAVEATREQLFRRLDGPVPYQAWPQSALAPPDALTPADGNSNELWAFFSCNFTEPTPVQVRVVPASWSELPDGSVRVEQEVHVPSTGVRKARGRGGRFALLVQECLPLLREQTFFVLPPTPFVPKKKRN